MKKFTLKVYQETGIDLVVDYDVDIFEEYPYKLYEVLASTPEDAQLIAFAVDGGFGKTYDVDEGHLELAKSYCEVIHETCETT